MNDSAEQVLGSPLEPTPYAVTPATWNAAYAAGQQVDTRERPVALLGALAVTAALALLAIVVWSGAYAPRLSSFSGGGRPASVSTQAFDIELDLYNGGLLAERQLRADVAAPGASSPGGNGSGDNGSGVEVVRTQIATGVLSAHSTTRVTVTVQVTDCATALPAARSQQLKIVLSGHRPWGWMSARGELADPLSDLVVMSCDPTGTP